LSEAQAAEEATAWHRRFAAAGNNRAWDLSEQTRDAAQDREMLDAAHAAAWHWTKVGTELNRMRATMLLAEVHALLGLGRSALAYAEEMRAYFLGIQSPDWEVAFVHVIHAHAASAAGEAEKHRTSYGLAVAALGAVSNDKQRALAARTFSHVPKPWINHQMTRAAIRREVASILPFDEQEENHRADALAWIDSGAPLFRTAKPAMPPKHLVSYFVIVDGREILLVDHKNAQLW
jgi:hypothetical protein